MQGISNSYGAFSETFETNSQQGLIAIHPEMAHVRVGISLTGRYHVHGVAVQPAAPCLLPAKTTINAAARD